VRTQEDPTAKAVRVWEKMAPRYDRDIQFWEKVQFGGGRAWIGARAKGRILEVAVGTGRNFDLLTRCGHYGGRPEPRHAGHRPPACHRPRP
jgi:hypothetical protein